VAYKAKSKTYQPTDTYQVITDQIVKLLETGVRPWSRSWGGSEVALRPLRVTGQPYRGINVLVLWMTAQANGYTNSTWMTFNQAKELGANVRKGEHGAQIIYYTTRVVNEGTEDEQKYPMLRTFTVFNCDQIENLPEKFLVKAEPIIAVAKNERIPHVEAFFNALPIEVKHGGVKAFHNPQTRRIQMPNFEDFFTPEAYYTTRYHESIHWTRHKDALDRNFGQARYGDDGYAMEELVAELGAAYGSADLGLINHPREYHANYIASWLKVLKNDKRAIFTAASHAEKAVKHLHEIVNPASAVVAEVGEIEIAEVEERIAA
jgi:antirestriction protein ArdC